MSVVEGWRSAIVALMHAADIVDENPVVGPQGILGKARDRPEGSDLSSRLQQ